MHSACHQGPPSSRAATFCASLLFLSLSLFLTTNAVARDSTGNKGDTSSGETRTPKIDFIGNKAFRSEKLLQALSIGRPRWFAPSASCKPDATHEVTDFLMVFYYAHR